MHSLLEIIQRTTEFLARKGVEQPRLNAELLAGHVLGLPRMQLYLQFERPLTEDDLARLRPLVKRRGDREPLQHLLGEVDFCDLKVKVDRRGLIPRPETEMLVGIVRERVTAPPRRILDLGTGTGAIAVALASAYPEAEVVAVDASGDALALAAENVARLVPGRVRLLESDWFSALGAGEKYDLIVSNPPYLTKAEVAAAAPEVRDFEPAAALTPGDDGLAALRLIVTESRSRLNPGGLLACETGLDQHAALAELATKCGYARSERLPDLTKRERFFLAFV